MSAVLVDTNVFVYAADHDQPWKRHIARRVVHHLEPCILVSAQVLAEYAHVLTHPSRYGLLPAEVIPHVRLMSSTWPVIPLSASVVIAALEASERWGMPYYDAQIWAAAALNNVPVVLSEDFPSGAVLGGVRFVNPFAPDFDVAMLD